MERWLRRCRWGVLVVAGVTVVGWAVWGWVASRSGTPTPSSAMPQRWRTTRLDEGHLPDFSLIDERGQPFTRGHLAGTVWVADFIFTRCAGQCPLISQRMAALQKTWAHLAGVSFVSFSVDPSTDTPDVLRAYARRYGADPQRWRFVTGDPQAMARLVRDGFHLGLGPGTSPQEPITHSVRLVLIDRGGRLRGYYDATDDEALARLERDVRRVAAEPS